MFLDPAQLRTLTGYAHKGKQIEVLRARGIPFWINGRGAPVVASAAVEAAELQRVQAQEAANRLARWSQATAEARKVERATEKIARAATKARERELRAVLRDERAALVRHHAAKRRAAKLLRTPSWANLDAIRAIYERAHALTASTGIPHHVDHFYPLQGRLVSGLHVETNLQILTGSENSRKRNRFEPC